MSINKIAASGGLLGTNTGQYETVTTGDWNTANPAAGDLFATVFESEVLARFPEYLTFASKLRSKTISTGKVAKFPATWQLETAIHNRGDELFGQETPTREYEIRLEDRPVVSTYETDDIEQELSYYDIRSELATEAARALARQFDIKAMYWLIQAATFENAADADFDFPEGLGAVTDADTDTADADGAAAILDQCQQFAVALDVNYAPMDNRYCAVSPGMWYALKNAGVPATGSEFGTKEPFFGNTNYSNGGSGIVPVASYDEVLVHNGVNIFRSPWLADSTLIADRSSDGSIDALYRKDYSNVSAILFQQQAVATVLHTGLKTEMSRDVRRQTDFMVAKMYTGGGILRPHCAKVIKSA